MVVILFLNFISVWAITQAGKLSARILGKTFNWRSFNKSRQQLTLRCCNAKCYRLVKIKLPNQYCNFNLMDSMPLINVKALVKEWFIKSSRRRYNFKRLPQNYPLTFQGESAHGPRQIILRMSFKILPIWPNLDVHDWTNPKKGSTPITIYTRWPAYRRMYNKIC